MILCYEISKYFKLYKWQNRLSKKCNRSAKNCNFFKLAFGALKFWNIISYFIEGIRSWKCWVFQIASQALNLQKFKLYHTRNRFAKRMKFLSKIFELWKFEFIQVFSKMKTVCEKAEIFQQSIWAKKFWNISN